MGAEVKSYGGRRIAGVVAMDLNDAIRRLKIEKEQIERVILALEEWRSECGSGILPEITRDDVCQSIYAVIPGGAGVLADSQVNSSV